ncbi:MAG: tetratricopeptide repeat protein [Deltaproteobacteria bacterium]|nr:tetratricopeptide repeat protein [Deltaproteobacteria bacterium]
MKYILVYKFAIFFCLIFVGDLHSQIKDQSYEDKESAKIHFEAAKKLYKSEKYAEALELFMKAYSRYPRPEILYNIGKCYDKLGDYANAIKFYEQYILLNPQAEDRHEVEELINNLKEAIRTPERVIVGDKEKNRALTNKVIGYSLGSLGLLSLALGPVFYLKSDSIYNEVREKDYDEKTRARKIDDIHFYDNLSLVSYVTGCILLGSSAYFLYKGYYIRNVTSITPMNNGFYLTFSGEF